MNQITEGNLIIPGLVSVTFRALSPEQIISLVCKAGLQGIEWGGDIHVPQGDLAQARAVHRMTRDAGLKVAAYGSYYRIWPNETAPFETVLETAAELGAPLIRVWAGKIGSKETGPDERVRIIDGVRKIAGIAEQAGISVAMEYHANTLTDTLESTLDLLRTANHPNLGVYWQPPTPRSAAQRLAELKAILPWLRNVHVFQWHTVAGEVLRLPLREGEEEWKHYLQIVSKTGKDHFALLEFVINDSPERFLEDGHTLIQWINHPGDFIDIPSGAC